MGLQPKLWANVQADPHPRPYCFERTADELSNSSCCRQTRSERLCRPIQFLRIELLSSRCSERLLQSCAPESAVPSRGAYLSVGGAANRYTTVQPKCRPWLQRQTRLLNGDCGKHFRVTRGLSRRTRSSPSIYVSENTAD